MHTCLKATRRSWGYNAQSYICINRLSTFHTYVIIGKSQKVVYSKRQKLERNVAHLFQQVCTHNKEGDVSCIINAKVGSNNIQSPLTPAQTLGRGRQFGSYNSLSHLLSYVRRWWLVEGISHPL